MPEQDVALYFPFIRVPNSAWFSQILLYWDKAAAIVPSTLAEPPAEDPYIRTLSSAQLLETVHPEEYVYGMQLGLGFLDVADVPARAAPNATFTRLHKGKAEHGLFLRLEERGLAHPSQVGPWWEVETSTAGMYMAYLAAAIGAAQGMIPVTDVAGALGALAGNEGTLRQRLAELRYETITGVLPAPAAAVPVEDLLDFKRRHAEDLRRCRTHLDAKLVNLAKVDDPSELEIRRQGVRQEIEDELGRLSHDMRKRKWPLVLAGVGAALTVAGGVGTTLVQGGHPLGVGLSVGATVVSQVPAVTAAVMQAMHDGRQPPSPLAYAFAVGSLGVPQGPDPTLW